jgi:hypothetical protein
MSATHFILTCTAHYSSIASRLYITRVSRIYYSCLATRLLYLHSESMNVWCMFRQPQHHCKNASPSYQHIMFHLFERNGSWLLSGRLALRHSWYEAYSSISLFYTEEDANYDWISCNVLSIQEGKEALWLHMHATQIVSGIYLHTWMCGLRMQTPYLGKWLRGATFEHDPPRLGSRKVKLFETHVTRDRWYLEKLKVSESLDFHISTSPYFYHFVIFVYWTQEGLISNRSCIRNTAT